MTDSPTTLCGTFVLAGRPNAGKSTLFNRLVGRKLALTSPKPQSTRQAVTGIMTERDAQLIFVDPPGLLDPDHPLQEVMMDEVVRHLRSANGILYLHPLADWPPPSLHTILPAGIRLAKPILTVCTKADVAPRAKRTRVPSPAVVVSATTGEGLETIPGWCRSRSPVAPFRYDAEDLSAQPVRFFAAEFVRQAAFDLLGEELPYALAAQVEEFRESRDTVYIRVSLYVERESQKGIVIGSGGRKIRALGASARTEIEALLQRRVYLDLWVKVLPKWRTSPHVLRQLGFAMSAGRSR